jgi:hypothetical protein
MKSQQLTFEQLMEIGLALNKIEAEQKDMIMNYVIGLNNAVREYENRIKNAVYQLEN